MSTASTGYSLTGVQVQDEGSNLGLATFLDFTGAGVTATASGSVITVNIPGGGGGGGAPANAQYLTLVADATLTQERVFTPSANFLVVDNGAGNPYDIDLSNTTVAAGSYTYASLTVDAKGRLTAASSGVAPVTSVSVDAGELTNTGTATAPVLGLATTGVVAASYTYASLTVDTFGRLTAASSGVAPVTSVSVDAGELTNTGTATAPVLGLATTGVVAASYTSADITVDAFGRITAAASGTPASAAGWTDGGTNVYLTTLTDQVALGIVAPFASVKQSIQNDAGGNGILVRATAGGSEAAYNTRQFTDTFDRFALQTSGIHLWGSGTAAAEVRQQRTGLNAFAFNHSSGATTITWSVVGTLLTPSRRVQTNTVTAAALNIDANPAIYDTVFCDPTLAPQTITLPNPATAGNSGRRYTIKRVNTSANTVTVNSAGGATIDGAASQVLAGGTLNAITVVTDGTAWWIV